MNKSSMNLVLQHPDFKKMEMEKNRISWFFSFLVFAVYVAYILYIGINPEFFSRPLVAGSAITIGIYAGIGIILFSIILTGIYVRKVNKKFDEVTQKVIHDIEGGE
ncbi:MAG: DUF485 domain-containing protein [Betaproteobacteria bacterium]|nr:DUF485 domain-containing protein [Betaproteobacteria bacterium]